MKEGDTPAFLYLIPDGLGVPGQPELGSWGGRFDGPGPRYLVKKDPGKLCFAGAKRIIIPSPRAWNGACASRAKLTTNP